MTGDEINSLYDAIRVAGYQRKALIVLSRDAYMGLRQRRDWATLFDPVAPPGRETLLGCRYVVDDNEPQRFSVWSDPTVGNIMPAPSGEDS